MLAGLIARGQHDGSLRAGGEPADLAAVVHVALDGLQVPPASAPNGRIDRTVDTLLGLL